MPPSDPLKLREDLELEELDGELLVYDAAREQLLRLNPMGALIWRLCDGTRTRAEILGLLRSGWPEAGDQVDRDLDAVLAVMRRADVFQEG